MKKAFKFLSLFGTVFAVVAALFVAACSSPASSGSGYGITADQWNWKGAGCYSTIWNELPYDLDWGTDGNGISVASGKVNSINSGLRITFTSGNNDALLKVLSSGYNDKTLICVLGDGKKTKDYQHQSATDPFVVVNAVKNKTNASVIVMLSAEDIQDFVENGFIIIGTGITVSKIETVNWGLVNDFDSITTKSGWHCADWANGGMFGCDWRPNHITYENGKMVIKIDNSTDGRSQTSYTGGELRTDDVYGYGFYEVKMKPCKKSGTNSSFFLYTEDGWWDEIDIEFLGKDTSKVQFNCYIKGVGEHEKLYGFGESGHGDTAMDASEDFHTYGIEYTKNYITWYVDGVPVYTFNGCENNGHHVLPDENGKKKGHEMGSVPTKPMQIMINFWPGKMPDMEGWLGNFSYSQALTAEYEYVKYLPY